MREIQAMTNLLDDPDMNIYVQIEQQLIDIGYQVLPELENLWNRSNDHLVQSRIESIIDRINFNKILDEFNVWKSLANPDLIDALAILNKLQHPLVDCLPFYQIIENKTKEIWLEFNEHLTSFELVNVLNKILFEFWGFKSVHDNDQSAFQQHFFSSLMEKKSGNQYSIACLYLILAEKLKLPIYPVLLADQLILAYIKSNRLPGEIEVDDVLFYINPNEGGIMFDDNSIKSWIQKHNLDIDDRLYLPVDTKQLVNAYIGRMISGYEQTNQKRRAEFLKSLMG